ncbi:extracellular elastinolytic metalloproteinase, partial [Rhizoctonia solani 123E]
MVHDLYYRYGFDEVSGNFQQDNYGRGGQDNDAVIAYAQDISESSNARFRTPPDGKHGRCHMYLWDYLSPARDSDLDASLLIHELTHGLSNRLTGGPANSGCLSFGESGGLGEGWSDFLAIVIRSTRYAGDGDFAVGDWVSGDIIGLRYYLYST